MFQILTWGANSHGQLGQGTCTEQCEWPLPLDQLPANLRPEEICEIRGGGGHLLLLDRRGQVFVCGCNDHGQLGRGESPDNCSRLHQLPAGYFHGERVRAVRAGWDMSAAITDAGNVFVWGSNAFGQLGLEAGLKRVDEPRQLQLQQSTGCVDLQFGLRFSVLLYPDHLIVVGAERTLHKITRNASHPGEMLLVGGLLCWKLAVSATHVSCGTQHLAYIVADTPRLVHGCGDNRHGQSGPAPALVADCLELRSGWTHNAVLTVAGKMCMWGRNNFGQLGRGQAVKSQDDDTDRLDELQAPDGEVDGDGGVLDDAEQMHLGAEHGLLVRRDGALLTWGWNEHGNCGDGTVADVWRPKRVKLPGRCVLAGTGCGFCVAIVAIEDGINAVEL